MCCWREREKTCSRSPDHSSPGCVDRSVYSTWTPHRYARGIQDRYEGGGESAPVPRPPLRVMRVSMSVPTSVSSESSAESVPGSVDS